MSNKNDDYYFLKGGGEMGELIRAKDWSKTSLGDPVDWPQSLRTMVAVMLDNPFGMYIAWGSEYIQLYNDGYRPILGANKHPGALGISTQETFSEIWHIIKSMFDGVMNGKPVGFPDLMLPLNRNGFVEECYFDFSYSPIRKDDGEVGGVLVTVIETTNKKKTEEALKESEARFRAIADDAPVFIFLAGENAEVEYLNKTWREYTGISTNDYKGRAWAEITHIDDIEPATKIYMDGFNKRESCSFENRQKGIDGIYRTFLWKATPRFSLNGQFIGMMGVGLDIHERKKSEEKLRESEQKVRALVENAPFPIAVYVGREMIVELANQSIIDIWGKGNDVIGKSFKEVLPELDNQSVFEQIQQVLETGESFHTKNTPLDLIIDGKPYTFYFNYSFTPLYDISGNIYGVMNTGVDLTELNIAKKKIEESDKRFRTTVKQAPVGITILRGPEYLVEMANEVYLALVDREESTFVGRPLFDSLPEVKNSVSTLLAGVLNTGIPYHGNEVPIPLNRSGSIGTFYFDFLYAPLKEEHGKISGIIVTVTEVSEKVEARKKIEESKEVIRESKERLEFVLESAKGGDWDMDLLTGKAITSFRHDQCFGATEPFVDWSYEKFLSYVHPDDRESEDRKFKEAVATGSDWSIDCRVVWNDDTVHWIQSSGRNYKFIDGMPTRMLGMVREVTEQKEAQKQIEESERNLKLMIHQAPVSISILRGLDYTVDIVNKHALELWGRAEQEVLGKSVFISMPELLTQGIKELLDDVINTGKRFATGEMPVQLLRNGIMETVYINFSYEPLYDAYEKINGIMTVGMDVTHQVVARKKIEDSEKRYNLMLMQSPFAFLILKGKDLVVHLANESMKEVLGKGSDIEGKPLLEVLPELKGQAFPELLDNVYNTGIPFSANEMLAQLTRNGKLEDVYFNYVYQPYYEADNTISGVTVIAYDVTSSVIANKKIEASEQRLNIVVEASELGTWEIDLTTNDFIYSNRYLEIMGYPHNKVITVDDTEKLIHPDYTRLKDDAIKKSRDTGVFYFVGKIIWEDNSIHWIESKARLFYDEQNQPLKIIGTTEDITTERTHQQELEESEEKFRLLADSMPQHIWTSDPEGNLNYYNQSVFDYSGLTLEQINKVGWIQIVHPDDREENIKQWINSITTGKDFLFEHRFRKHDGEYRWQLSRAIPQRDETGKIQMWVGTSTDIQEQKTFAKELEEQVITRTAELKASEEKFYNLFNLSPISKTLSDTSSGKIVMVNDAFTKLFGYSREVALGKSSAELGLLDLEEREIIINELKTNGKIENKEIWFIKKSGERFIALASAEVISIGDNQFFLSAFNDISEIKKAEQNIKQKNIELEKMNKELQSFAYISSHDLQEPLRKIQTFASLITEKEENNLSDYGRDMFNRMQDSAKRMQTLIQDLLAYSRANTAERKFETTDLNKIVAEVKEDLKEDLKEKHASIEAHQLCNADIIPFQFRQLMLNLIGNSLKFSRPDHPPLIQIKSEITNGIKLNNEKLSPQNKYCHITVSDNGIGFEQQYSEKIFELFQRLHGKKEYDGTGIGLSIVKKIVENHHGIITANGELNKGATFEIYIPAI